jgi:esterase
MVKQPLLHYKVVGEGPTVVLLHGLFGSLENLGMVARELSKNFQVISIDLPDHGQSYRTLNFSYETYARSVVETLASKGISTYSLVGHSMGGKVAMCIALTEPNPVQKLVVADIAPVAYENRHQNVLTALSGIDLNQLESRKHAEHQMNNTIQEPGVKQFLLKSLTQTDGQWSWRFNLDLILRDYSVISEGINFSSPYSGQTLFVKGSESNYLTLEHQQAVVDRFPNSKVKIIQGTGHWLHAEKPVAFNKIVNDFLLSK